MFFYQQQMKDQEAAWEKRLAEARREMEVSGGRGEWEKRLAEARREVEVSGGRDSLRPGGRWR